MPAAGGHQPADAVRVRRAAPRRSAASATSARPRRPPWSPAVRPSGPTSSQTAQRGAHRPRRVDAPARPATAAVGVRGAPARASSGTGTGTAVPGRRRRATERSAASTSRAAARLATGTSRSGRCATTYIAPEPAADHHGLLPPVRSRHHRRVHRDRDRARAARAAPRPAWPAAAHGSARAAAPGRRAPAPPPAGAGRTGRRRPGRGWPAQAHPRTVDRAAPARRGRSAELADRIGHHDRVQALPQERRGDHRVQVGAPATGGASGVTSASWSSS